MPEQSPIDAAFQALADELAGIDVDRITGWPAEVVEAIVDLKTIVGMGLKGVRANATTVADLLDASGDLLCRAAVRREAEKN